MVTLLIVCNVLKKRRLENNLSQKELADKVNIAQTYYSDIERGRCNPSLNVFSKLATVLDIDMNILKQDEILNCAEKGKSE